MTNTTDIDWSKAPEDAQFYCTDNFMCYKVVDDSLYMSDRIGDKWDESCLSAKDIQYDSSFIPRPVQQNIQQTVAVSVQMNKPPIGLMPKHIFIEQMQMQRRNEITAAVQRYIEVGKDIPNDWLQELIELNNVIQNVQPEAVEDSDVEPKWIEWGVNRQPTGLEGKIVERQYTDGEYRTGGADDFTWNTHCSEIDRDTVARYRVVGEEEGE